ncbi:hypothetical protein GCM10010307_53120 [Streptomyces vastus]|uniref:BHLH domain-containing protein n=1 Tax=Streptomyces vastus TaxID=285451 RepID=A0ABP6DK84_9ACTN
MGQQLVAERAVVDVEQRVVGRGGQGVEEEARQVMPVPVAVARPTPARSATAAWVACAGPPSTRKRDRKRTETERKINDGVAQLKQKIAAWPAPPTRGNTPQPRMVGAGQAGPAPAAVAVTVAARSTPTRLGGACTAGPWVQLLHPV